MAITTALMDEILQHFARVFPIPGRIDGCEDYLALVKTWADQLEPYSDEQVKEACRRLMGKLKRFPYPSDVRDELAPARAAPIIGTASAMPPHQQRVIDERADLGEKIAKLVTFQQESKIYAGLDEPEKDRLRRQENAMYAYWKVLGERIDAFLNASKN